MLFARRTAHLPSSEGEVFYWFWLLKQAQNIVRNVPHILSSSAFLLTGCEVKAGYGLN